ncbi:putative PurR-regulated permease PerM [Streptosporangium becharense]|uniref:Putative PurR-regulated permease PerM n=1 Tax=Streptosporangium becharense TaxID=1816182 RepID=A0A7W9IF16_9ACTN|nr:AI-2E family transporter [Streptosporangium becharense]MBB2910126.1 putative PurR-regulated permease PerM [Streptosporangium becharense]MBB5818919.1 putative PurR-regulated permease PerM [Streptosporangium becharense]
MTDQRVMPRPFVVLGCAACGVVTLAGIREVGSIVGPALLALVLVLAVSPVRTWLGRRGAPGWTLVAVPLVLVLLLLLGIVAILILAVAQLAALAPTYGPQFTELVADVQNLAGRLGVGTEQMNEAIKTLDPGKVFQLVQGFATGLLGVLSGLVLIVVLVLAMCLDARTFSKALAMGATRRPKLIGALENFAQKTRRYLVVSTVFGLVCAVLDVGALWLLGVPLPLLWGVLALITNYIPNIGFVLGLVPPALLGLLESGPRTMLLVIVSYMVINFVVQSLVQPKFMGDAVGLSTTMTLLSLMLWAFVLGPLGALLAIPLSLLVRALLVDSDPEGDWAAVLVSGEAPRTDTPEKRTAPVR